MGQSHSVDDSRFNIPMALQETSKLIEASAYSLAGEMDAITIGELVFIAARLEKIASTLGTRRLEVRRPSSEFSGKLRVVAS